MVLSPLDANHDGFEELGIGRSRKGEKNKRALRQQKGHLSRMREVGSSARL
jgi:hypothetical protein